MKRRVRSWLGAALGVPLAAIFGIIALRRRAATRPAPAAPARVLLVRCDALMGDLVNGLSAAYAVKRAWPDAHVAFAAPSAWAPIVSRCSAVDEVLGFDCGAITHVPACFNPAAWRRWWRALKRLRDGKFDVAVSIYGRIAGSVVGLSGARQRIGYASEAPPFCFDRALAGRRRNGGPHEAELATALITTHPPEWLVLDRAANLPRPGVVDAERPLIVLHPGTTHGSAKRWPVEHWAALAARLRCSVGGTLAIVGLPHDRAVAAAIQAADPAAVDLVGRTELDELMGVLHAAQAAVSSDSGPAHLARALGTPVVALHGPTDIALHGPGDPKCIALCVRIPCGPCYDFSGPAECRFGDVLCMRWLEPASVAQAVASVLAAEAT